MISTFYLGADGQNCIKVPIIIIIIINIILINVFISDVFLMLVHCFNSI